MALGAHRKVVTVLFCDIVGSTELGESVDPETLDGLLVRYFERMQSIIESHGGTVEKFIGDAVMAVFGAPVAHEDDALRACRAAVEMRDALPALQVAGRIGVNSGEVLTGTERLATGDAVNVAARLEQAAGAGEVLIGAETLALVGAGVGVGEERLLELKGKAAPVAGYVLHTIRDAAERSHSARFVGRRHELRVLLDAWDRALAGGQCEWVTVVGEPGVGKSRLVAEAIAQIDGRVVLGRCLSYGDGITYWPVVEVLKQLDTVPSDDLAAGAIRSLLGESEVASSPDEIAWAFRKLLGEQSPLVVCFEDIQWGDETFLDLIESTALLSTGSPLLLVCIARPELLERRPGWPAPLRLGPLPDRDTLDLVADSVRSDLREQIVQASGGNPLFVTEMLALAEEGSAVQVPATLRALLAARLDQLNEPERRVLERGAVEGELFHHGTVQALVPEEKEVSPRLAALVRRELIRPDRPQILREEAYRFRHLLIRDAAYDALPKGTRATLHRRFADWLREHGHGLVELDEILGYHLEQAARYLAELGQPDAEIELAAGERLAAAGRRAFWQRADFRAAAPLLARSLELTRAYRVDVSLEAELANAIRWSEGSASAVAVAEAAAVRAEAAGDEAGAGLARVVAATLRLHTGDCVPDDLERLGRDALPRLEAAEDHDGLFHVWQALGWVANTRAQMADWAEAFEQSLLHARLAGHTVRGSLGTSSPLTMGPLPASEALARFDALLGDNPHPADLVLRALLLAMLDRIPEAWEIGVPAEEKAREFGVENGNIWLSEIALIAGDLDAAARYLRETCELLERTGGTSFLSTYAPQLGRVLCKLGHENEAEQLAWRGRDLGDADDVWTQALWRQALALVHSARGEHASAEQFAGEALEWISRSDSLLRQGDAFVDLAEVREAAGQRERAIAAWNEALDCYQRKEIIPLARRARERLAELQPARA